MVCKNDLLRELYSIECQIENLKFLKLDDKEEIKKLEEQRNKIENKLKKLKEEE